MFNQKYLVLFIDRNRFALFGGPLTDVAVLEIPDLLIHDLDVLSKDGCYSLIKQWVKQHAISGSSLIVLFSETTYFEKLFSMQEQSQIESDVLKFFDMVPFESVWTKVYSTEKGKRAVAINKALYDTIHQGFSLQGLQIKAVIPSFALGDQSTKRSLDRELGEYVIKNIDTLMKQSLLDSQELSVPVPQHESQEQPGGEKKKSQLPLLLTVFGILIAILGVVIFLQFR